jgi:two-component sensor histidine kinase
VSYTIELWQSGEKVCAVHGYVVHELLYHAAGYAMQIQPDGEITIKVKNPRKAKK